MKSNAEDGHLHAATMTTLDEINEIVQGVSTIVLGAGVSGLSLAFELGKYGNSCLLFDMGTSANSTLNENTAEDAGQFKLKAESRVVGIGGGSREWGGLVTTLTRCEFEQDGKQIWPFSHDTLRSLYEQIDTAYGLPQFEIQSSELLESARVLPKRQGLNHKVFLANKPAPNFEQLIKQENFKSRVIEKFQLEEILFNHATQSVAGLIFYDLSRNEKVKIEISPEQRIVLALNAIESVRVVLNSPQMASVIRDKPVGKYIMNHPKGIIGEVKGKVTLENEGIIWGFKRGALSGFIGLTNSEDVAGVARHYVRLEPVFPWSDSALVELALKAIRILPFNEKLFGQKTLVLSTIAEAEEYGDRIISHSWISELSAFWQYILFRAFGRPAQQSGVRIRIVLDIPPNPENCIQLADKLNANGYRLARVEMNPDDDIYDGIQSLLNEVRYFLEDIGLNCSDFEVPKKFKWSEFQDASHHLGGLRMAYQARESVVDSDQKFRDTQNLYVTGAPVLPSSGCSNPVYTIIALNIRLAMHLSENIGKLN